MTEAFFEEQGHHAILFTFIGKMIGGEIRFHIQRKLKKLHGSNPYSRKILTYTKRSGRIDEHKIFRPYIFRGTVINKY
ncbi:hypothetical protein GCM10011409_18330 [Lentibacillus populi]|uniref:Uncharacterized protein n=1 Tax=Lentibacillus populi TaxID=1827502 RepID=A0A9W5TXL3_9BACI|nr:hypothetical protein GCM10011409_18330 [Lentibacillus populi]